MNRWLSVTYCDDIRQELGNKHSFMGVYGPLLLVPQIPITLPKMCVFVTAYTHRAQPFERITFQLLHDHDVLVESLIADEVLRDLVKQVPEPRDEDEAGRKLLAVGAIFALSPFVIEREFVLRVRVKTEGEDIRGQALRIALSPDAI